MQRDRRKEMEKTGTSWTPIWFEKRDDPYDDAKEAWRYKGDYWESRGLFKNIPELW